MARLRNRGRDRDHTRRAASGGGGGGGSFPFSGSDDFSGDLSKWDLIGDGTKAIASGKLKLESAGAGNGATFKTPIPDGWTEIDINFKARLSAAGNCDILAGIADGNAGLIHGGLTPHADNGMHFDGFGGAGARQRIGKTVAGSFSLVSDAAWTVGTTEYSYQLLFTRSGEDIRLRTYRNAIALADQTISHAALNGAVYACLHTWAAGGGQFIEYDDFTVDAVDT